MSVRAGVAAVLVGVALVVSGCGIPDNTGVNKFRDGTPTGYLAGEDSVLDKVTREEADTNKELIENYLRAAAAIDQETAMSQVKSFLSTSMSQAFKAPTDAVKIVHAEEPLSNPGSDEVTVEARTVGVLTRNGVLEPSQDTGVQKYSFKVTEIAGQEGLFVSEAPQVLLLSDDAFQSYYTPRTVYFWNRERTGLVPDLRYLSSEVPNEQVPQEAVKWLIDGPPAWLYDSVEPLPEGTRLIGNVPKATNGELTINLSSEAVQPPDDPEALERLRIQLMWSLREQLPRVLQLKIENQQQHTYEGTDYFTSNASSRLQSTPERFVVFDGQVRRMSGSPRATDPIPVLRPEDNKDVRAAAFATSPASRTYAAVVTSRDDKQVLHVGSAPAGQQSDLRAVPLPGGSTGQPVWAITSDDDVQTGALGLITVGGRLYGFRSDGTGFAEIPWTGSGGAISAVSVAPDGRRIALAVGGTLYIAGITTEGDRPELSTPQRVGLWRVSGVTAVDWASETSVMVAGTDTDNDRIAIVETSIDGLRSLTIATDMGAEPVTYLAVYPISPLMRSRISPEAIEYMAKGAAFDVISVPPVRIGVSSLADPVTDPPSGAGPTNPFFLR